jgi:L,D-transpeptidase catalytic domain
VWRVIVSCALLVGGAPIIAACGESAASAHPPGHDEPIHPPVPVTSAASATAEPVSDPVTVPLVVDVTPQPRGDCVPGVRHLQLGARSTILYVVGGRSDVRTLPWPSAKRVAHFGPRNLYGLRTVLLGLDRYVDTWCRTTWYRVAMPAKPNGVTGWVPASGVIADAVDTRIVADVDARKLVLYREGKRLVEMPMAVGAAGTPTPRGLFFVESRFRFVDPNGAFGPAALALSGFSQAQEGWGKGNPIAIHGTNEPSSIGQAASSGCLRISNRNVGVLLALVRSGTPVLVH